MSWTIDLITFSDHIKVNMITIIEAILMLWKQKIMLLKHVSLIKTHRRFKINFLLFINFVFHIKITMFIQVNNQIVNHRLLMKYFSILMKFIFKKIKHFYSQQIVFNNSKISIVRKTRFRRKTIKTRTMNNVNFFAFLSITIIKINYDVFRSHNRVKHNKFITTKRMKIKIFRVKKITKFKKIMMKTQISLKMKIMMRNTMKSSISWMIITIIMFKLIMMNDCHQIKR